MSMFFMVLESDKITEIKLQISRRTHENRSVSLSCIRIFSVFKNAQIKPIKGQLCRTWHYIEEFVEVWFNNLY